MEKISVLCENSFILEPSLMQTNPEPFFATRAESKKQSGEMAQEVELLVCIHSYSFNPDINFHIHLAECTIRLLNQASRNKYPYNPKFLETPGSIHSEVWNDCSFKCTSLILTGYKILWIPVIGQLQCNDSAVGTTEVK